MPTVGKRDVLIKVRRVGVCGSDVHYYFSGGIGIHVVEKPIILGHECAGDVVEVGEAVTDIEPGMRVVVEPGVPCRECTYCRTGRYNICRKMRFMGTPPVDGAFCEYVSWPMDFVFPMPDGMSYEEGAMIEPAAVGIYATDLAEMKSGYSAAILGSAAIGLTTLQAAILAGAQRTFITDLVPSRLKLAEKFGATSTINSEEQDPVKVILDQSDGVDVVFEAAGVVSTLQQCVEVVKPGGVIILIGINQKDVVPFNIAGARRKEATIKLVRRYRHVFPRTIRLVADKRLDVASLITHQFPMSQIDEAFELVRERRGGVVKAVIVI